MSAILGDMHFIHIVVNIFRGRNCKGNLNLKKKHNIVFFMGNKKYHRLKVRKECLVYSAIYPEYALSIKNNIKLLLMNIKGIYYRLRRVVCCRYRKKWLKFKQEERSKISYG